MVRKSKYIPIIFTIISLFLILLLNTSPVHGTGDVNGQGTDAGQSTETGIIGGWSTNNCGLRIYVINESNTAKSPVIDVWFSFKWQELQQVAYRAGTRACEAFSSQSTAVLASELLQGDAPMPWIDYASNQSTLEGWLLTIQDGEDVCNAELAIRELFGDHVLDEFYENADYDPYYLCIEGLACFGVYRPTGETKVNGVWQNFTNLYFAGSFYNFCQYCNGKGWQTGGVPLKSRTNETFARALMLEEKGWSYNLTQTIAIPTQLDGVIETHTGLGRGYDIIMYRISDVTMNGVISTYDEALGESKGPAPTPKTKGQEGIFSIVKIYAVDHKDGSDLEYEGCYTRLKVCKNINISDEPLYTVREWITSKRVVKTPLPSGTTWPEVNTPYFQKGTSQGTVTLDPDPPKSERTLYVLLVREEEVDNEKDLILHESEISRYYELRDVKEFKGIDRRIQWTMNQISLGPCTYSPIHSDHGSYTDSEGNSHTIPCNCICNNRQVVITESHLTFKVKNVLENSYSHILATKGAKFKPEIFPKQIDREHTGTGQTTYIAPWNYKFVIWRGQDELTLSNYKLSSDKMSWLNASINTLVNRMNSKPQGTRWTQRETTVPINFKLEQDNTGDYQISARLSCGHDGDHTYETTVNRSIDANSEVLIETYSGSPSYTVSNSMASPQSSMTGVTRGNGVPVPNDAVFSFYPYIRMTYEEMGSTAKKDANVLSQHKRSFSFSDYAEIGWSSSFPNLAVTSQQWSVHQISTNKWGKNRVLPGGALHSIQTANGGTTLTLRTWQVVADGNGTTYARLQEAGSTGLENATKAKAKQEHQKFLQTCVQVWNNGYGLELGVNKNDGASDVFTGDYIIGTRGGGGFNGMLSSEEKYYFNNTEDSVGNIQSGLFQASAGGTSEQMYCISSDTQGNIYLDGSVILKKDQGVDKLSNALAKQIDARTKVISNFVSAIERNTGEDYTASWAEGEDDGKWYNEAFEVYVLVQTSKVTVTLSNPSRRETTMDTNLIPKNSGKSDYFSSGYSFQYRNTSGSITQGDIKGNSGEFRETGVSLATIDRVFRSKVFILPNVNVQDIKD